MRSSVIPTGNTAAPVQLLEDDDFVRRLLSRSDNGAASGPSGWGGNLLSSLAESDICRAGVVCLLKDILNDNLPIEARQYLLASRLVALNKPTPIEATPPAASEHDPHLIDFELFDPSTEAEIAPRPIIKR